MPGLSSRAASTSGSLEELAVTSGGRVSPLPSSRQCAGTQRRTSRSSSSNYCIPVHTTGSRRTACRRRSRRHRNHRSNRLHVAAVAVATAVANDRAAAAPVVADDHFLARDSARDPTESAQAHAIASAAAPAGPAAQVNDAMNFPLRAIGRVWVAIAFDKFAAGSGRAVSAWKSYRRN